MAKLHARILFVALAIVETLANTQVPNGGPILRFGTPGSVSLDPGPFNELRTNISNYLVPADYGSATFHKVHPLFPGATVMVGHQGTIVSHFAVGQTSKYADVDGSELPNSEQLPATEDTIYDMASLTKMFTSIIAMQQLDRGTLSLSSKVTTFVPTFSGNGKENVTILMLLTHTSGFDADPVDLWSNFPTFEERQQAIIKTDLINSPGSTYLYSDINFMVLQFVLEAITGKTLDVLVREDFTDPLGMKDTYFNRNNDPEKTARVAVTEFQVDAMSPKEEPLRPQPVWGTVHDENSWSLNGVAGHAGIFSTAMDLAIFCQMILNNGSYGNVQILRPSTVDLIFHNFNTAFPGNAHGLGFELDQNYWSGPMRSLQTAGHTGFTGTSMVIDRPSNTFFILLTNRVHPDRAWSSINIAREYLGYFVAKALGRPV